MDKQEYMGNPFLTVDDKGNPVDRRVTSCRGLREIYANFVREDTQEAARRLRIYRIYNGNLPFDPQKLKELALGNLTNINLLGLKGFIDGRVGAIADLAMDTVPLIELRPLAGHLGGPEAEKIAEIIAEEFSVTMRDGGELLPCLSSMFKECDLYGLGPVCWSSADGYVPEPLLRGQLKFAMNASVLSKKNEIYMFEATIPVHYLSDRLTHADASEKKGWNVKAIKRYLVDTYVSEKPVDGQPGDPSGTSVAESAAVEMRQNRWMEVNQFRPLKVLHTLIKEMNGKIRHTIIAPSGESEDYLYDKEDVYDNMDQCILWLPASVTETDARAMRGIASFIAPIEDVNNRLACQLYDASFRAGSFMLMSKSANQHNQQSIVERGPYVVLPMDLTPAQSQVIAPNLQQLAALREMGSTIAFNNASGVKAGNERVYSGADRKTQPQVQNEIAAKQQAERSLYALRVIVVDKFFRESFRRFMKLVTGEHKDFPEVDEFLTRCEQRGLSKEVVSKAGTTVFSVYTNRVLVTGGGLAQSAVLAQLLGNYGGAFDERGRVNIMRDIVRFQLGTRAADRYRPANGRDSAPSDASSMAVLENNSMQQGLPVLMGIDQMHWAHIPIHGQGIDSLVQLYQQAPQNIQDPQKMLNILQALSQHIQGHVQLGQMQPGMEQAGKAVMQKLSSLAPIIKGLALMASNIERQQKAAQAQQQKEMEALQQQADGKEQAVEMRRIDVKAGLKAREQDLMHSVNVKKAEDAKEVALIKAQGDAQVQIARQTQRMEQGMSITGRGPVQSVGGPAEAPVEDEDMMGTM